MGTEQPTRSANRVLSMQLLLFVSMAELGFIWDISHLTEDGIAG
jgi:hypothetical protein